MRTISVKRLRRSFSKDRHTEKDIYRDRQGQAQTDSEKHKHTEGHVSNYIDNPI